MPSPLDDEAFMRIALAEAAKGIGETSPNPAVGAVLVAKGKTIAAGYHKHAGAAHAEADCLQKLARPLPRNATLYVTLEPCSTIGRTPPCTDAIIAAGVRNVVIGALDPNPRHEGRGIAVLERAGINVRQGVLKKECSAINPGFNKWIRTGLPFVIAKCGMSLDGRLTTPPREPRWITSAAARRHANRRRAAADAILIGAGTLRADNPRLTVREGKRIRQPWRVILTRAGELPRDALVFTDRHADRTLVFQDQQLDRVLRELGQQEVTSVLIEGGGEVLAQALDARLIDQFELYLGSVLTGGPVLAFGGRGAASTADALRLHDVRYEKIGGDIFMIGSTGTEPSARVNV